MSEPARIAAAIKKELKTERGKKRFLHGKVVTPLCVKQTNGKVLVVLRTACGAEIDLWCDQGVTRDIHVEGRMSRDGFRRRVPEEGAWYKAELVETTIVLAPAGAPDVVAARRAACRIATS